MNSNLDELLQSCTVKIQVSPAYWGTGFFVAPGLILTCAHVVRKLGSERKIQIRWQQQQNFVEAKVIELRPEPELDLALLQFMPPPDADLPCVYLDEAVEAGHELYFFGYPDIHFPDGCPVTASCEGFTGDVPPLIKFKWGQGRPGMSGSALLNHRTGKVCGMVKFKLDRPFNLGGGAISTHVILEQFPELRDCQQQFHKRNKQWHDLLYATAAEHFKQLSLTGKIISYLRVFIFILSALIFWILFGYLADYSFPYSQAVILLLACFTGKIETNLDDYRIKFQNTKISTRINSRKSKKQARRLNNLNSQALLYRGILERFSTETAEDKAALSKTIEAIKQKKAEISEPLEQRVPAKYRWISELQENLYSALQSQAAKDLERIEIVINRLTKIAKEEHSFELLLESLVNDLSLELPQSIKKISPGNLDLLYKLQDLFETISRTQPHIRLDDNYQEIIDSLNAQIKSLSHQVESLSQERGDLKKENQQQRETISTQANEVQAIKRLNHEVKSLSEENENLKKKNHQYREDIATHENQFQSLKGELNNYNRLIKQFRDRSYRYKGDEIASWLELIIIQSEIVVNETVHPEKALLNSIHEGIKREWISAIHVYGLNSKLQAGIKISVDINQDYETASFCITKYSDRIPVISNLRDITHDFKLFISQHNEFSDDFRTMVEYVNPDKADFYNEQLGFEKSNFPIWASRKDYSTYQEDCSGCGCALGLVVVLFIIFSTFQPIDPGVNDIPNNSHIYWEELQKAIPKWDDEAAYRNIDLLSQSSNKCFLSFANRLKESLDLNGEEGFRDVNPIKRELNQSMGCGFEIIKYDPNFSA